ncbi:MAG: hypothetical protein V4619_15535 [Bacteroidota bacterium]
MTHEEPKKATIPTKYLPENWRNTVAEEFGIKPNMVGKVANGTRTNVAVFDHLLELAEKGKAEEQMRLDRLKNLQTQTA